MPVCEERLRRMEKTNCNRMMYSFTGALISCLEKFDLKSWMEEHIIIHYPHTQMQLQKLSNIDEDLDYEEWLGRKIGVTKCTKHHIHTRPLKIH
mgnify:CR=1 FL=1